MNKISAVIITKNEQQNIRRCLNSLVDVVDEIIVVDSYSTDDTEKICNDFDVEFIKKEFEDYSNSKNYGNSMAKHSFILSLDADEAISEELKESLALVKSKLNIWVPTAMIDPLPTIISSSVEGVAILFKIRFHKR